MKNHLPLLKETLKFMVQQLRSGDKLCIITFDHEVRVMSCFSLYIIAFFNFFTLKNHSFLHTCMQVKTELPLTAMTVSGKLQAEKAIEGVKERGHTNLSGGLLAALEALYR